MEPKVRGRKRIEDIDHVAFLEELNRVGNITRAAITFQIDPTMVKAQLLRKNLKICRHFKIVKDPTLQVIKKYEKKSPKGILELPGDRQIKISDLEATLNETGNISIASLKLGLVDSGVRTTLRTRGYDLKVEYVFQPVGKKTPARVTKSLS